MAERFLRVITEWIRYWPVPEADTEVEQRLSMNEKGQVWISRYRYGEKTEKHPLAEKEVLRISEKEAEEILNLAEALADSEKDFEAMDAGRWNLSVRNETGMEKTKSGSFLFGQEESIRTLCAAIRAAVGKEDLFLLDGGE